jgi:hypothetical protein
MRVQNKAPSRPAKGEKLYHYLLLLKLMFTADSRDGVGSHETNITITTKNPWITANQIGNAQQRAQIELFELLEDPSLRVLTATIGSVNYLGEMTKEEFYTPPLESAPEAGEAPVASVTPAPAVVQDAFSA